jgi:L-threonylcarbamoyladenylate synthase
MLQELLPDVRVFRKDSDALTAEEARQLEERPATPGMKYRHYSPTSPLMLFCGPANDATEQAIRDFINCELRADRSVARISLVPTVPRIVDDLYCEFPLAQSITDHEEMAKNLFAALRAADAMQPTIIVAQSVAEDDEGLAIMNRLEKAASITRNVAITLH